MFQASYDHHQELQQLQLQPLVYSWSVVVAVLLVVVGPAGTAVVVAPGDGHGDARNLLSCI